MSNISFNCRNGLSVGTGVIPISDALGNITATSMSVSGASTMGAISGTSLSINGTVSFSVNPTGVTASQNTNSTALATTAFVLGQKGSAIPLMNGIGSAGTSTLFAAQDHVHPSDTSVATNSTPSFSGNITINGGSPSTSSPFLTMSQTWTNSSTTYTGILTNITNTASGINSILASFQMNGIQQLGISASGTLIQTVTNSRLARTIISNLAELRTIREYQDLYDSQTVGGIQGLDPYTTTNFGRSFNAKWDTTTQTYVKDRTNAGDHAYYSRLEETSWKHQWMFSDGSIAASPILWSKRVEFDFPNSIYTFNGALNTTNLTVSGSVTGKLNLISPNAGIELGSVSASNSPYIDFHSSGGNIDYDARIIASAGSASTVGLGNLTYTAANNYFTGTIAQGIWNGSPIPVAYGGTGASTQPVALTNLMPSGATNGYVLTTSGPGLYYWAAQTGATAPVGNIIQSTRTLATATAGQTVFATPTYVRGASQLRVYINGVRQFSTEYTETTTTSFTLNAPGAALNDVVLIEVDGYINYSWSALATTFTPVGTITSTNVQGAITELSASLTNIAVPNLSIYALTSSLSSYAQLSGALFTGNVSYRGGGGVASNVAYGEGALTSNTTFGGSGNTATGNNALHFNTSGNSNTATGYSALKANTTGGGNSAFGESSLTANTSGGYNSAFGTQALYFNTTGYNNSAFGNAALFYNTTGYNNSAFGSQAGGRITTGVDNSVFGAYAGPNITTGYSNSAFGTNSLYFNTTGIYNSAFGTNALYNNNGNGNIANGTNAMYNNIGGSNNTANGVSTLYYSTYGGNNTVNGYFAMYTNSTGSNNTANGMYALYYNTIGINNSTVGYNSGGLVTTGSNNTLIGAYAGTDAVLTVTTQDNQICIGNNNSTGAFIKVAWSVVSDARDKSDFAPIPHGLDFVSKLSPLEYRLVESRENPYSPINATRRYGFLAQDILALEGDEPVIVNNTDPEHLKMTVDYLIPILVNAIKELKADFDEYKLVHP